MPIRAEFDNDSGALYVYLSDQAVARTEDREAEAYAVDLGEDGTVVGIEVLNLARAPGLPALAREWGFEDRLPEVRAVARSAFPTITTVATNTFSASTAMVLPTGFTGYLNVPFGYGMPVASQSMSAADPRRQQRAPEPV